MKAWLTTALLFCFLTTTIFAQSRLDGLWEGVITTGGLHSKKGYKFELVLEVKGKVIKGKSFIYISKDEVIEMEVSGKIYGDRSIYLRELQFISTVEQEVLPPFNRKYELVYKNSLWDASLEGYWQELKHESFDPRRERGRIFLKKSSKDKA